MTHTLPPISTQGQIARRRRKAIVVLVLVVAGLFAGIFGGIVAYQWRQEQHMRVWQGAIYHAAQETGLPRSLLTAVVRAESGGDASAVSGKQAEGLMQVRRDAEIDARRKLGLPPGKGDLKDPRYNLLIGSTYLRMLYDRFDGDIHLTLAAYHMGPTRVAKLRRTYPNLSSEQLVREHAGPATRAYIRRVLKFMN